MGYPGQPMPPGPPAPVVYRRRYPFWLLVLLIIVCWPVAIIYYFTRPKIAVAEHDPREGISPGR